ncbi:MAG: energy transducer TonB [Pseudomonadota bacterium]
MASADITRFSAQPRIAGTSRPFARWPGLSLAILGHLALLALVLNWHPELDRPHSEPILMASLVTPVSAEVPPPAIQPPPPAKPLPPPPRAEPAPPVQTLAATDPQEPTPRLVPPPPPPQPVVQAPPPPPLPMPEPVKQVLPTPSPVVVPPAPLAPQPMTQAAVPQPAPLSMESDEMKRYLATLMRQLARYKTYPAALKKAKIEGRVVLEFSIDARGRLVTTGIRKGSGSPELDQAALNMLARANPLPAIPAFLKRDQLELAIPVEYSLITDR